jgi:hypothetical protein
MDPLLLVSLTGAACLVTSSVLAATAFLGWRLRLRRARARSGVRVTEAVEQAAQALSLEAHSEGVWEGNVVLGARERRVRWNLRDVEYDTGPRLQLAVGTPVPTGMLGVNHRTLIYGAEPPHHDLPMVRLGEAEFDVRYFVHADLEHLSLLQSEVRVALARASDDAQLRIRNGWLWLDYLATLEMVAQVQDRLGDLFTAASALEQVPQEAEVRVRKLSQDPVARVRCTALDMLIARGASEFTTWIAKPLQQDLDPQVRVRVAEILGEPEPLLQLVVDAKAPADVRVRAAKMLSLVGDPAVRLKAAEALCKGEGPLAQMAVDLCTGLADDAENVLIELLYAKGGGVARQAVALLGLVGSARSLVVLQSLVDAADTSTVLRAEAKTVLDVIRSKTSRRNRSPSSTPPPATPVAQARRSRPPPAR